MLHFSLSHKAASKAKKKHECRLVNFSHYEFNGFDSYTRISVHRLLSLSFS